MTEFVVLTGFLGSGKTTLLRDFLAGPAAADTAVIVNEAGEVGLDGALLREVAGGVPMTTLANGCVCCQLGNDLHSTVEALLWAPRSPGAPPLRRVVLETSGLSKPGPVLRQLAALPADAPGHRLRVAVVATYDAAAGTRTAQFEEAAAQWAAAHRLVVTKADAVTAARLAEATDEARGINPLAQLVTGHDRARTVAEAFAPLAGGLPGEPPETGTAHPRIRVLLARPAPGLRYDDLAAWLDNLAGVLGERLLRLKGIVDVAGEDRPLLVQSVGTLFSPPRPFGGTRPAPFVVVIARDLRPGELDGVAPAGAFRFGKAGRALLAAH